MVMCKFFQQGNCRFGQYCRFQHLNNFGGGNQGNTTKPFAETKNIILGVAEEVLAAERGGQWLLSCFGPLKEQSCIPGMEDVSPEEVRWEMYQAQKNGTVDQTKLQFQQLCQAMTAKREALKNPTHETAAMLEKLQKTNTDGSFGGKSNFALSTPQMSQASNNPASSTSVFGASSFGAATNNPFAGGFNPSPSPSSIFGRAATNSTSVFGAKPSFGGNAIFGNQQTTNSVFGGAATTTTASVFGGNQNMQSFAATTSPSNSVFGAAPFGTTQASSPFGMAQAGQSTTSANNIFGGSSSALFGAAAQTPNLFGTAVAAQSANPFGAQSAAPASSAIGTASIFGAPKNTAAFGGAPVFGAAGGFGAPSSSVFGNQATFDSSQMPANNVFGGASTQSTTFGSNAQTTNTFGALASNQNASFGSVVSVANATPFGTSNAGPFGAAANNSPFGRTGPFTGSMQSGNDEAFNTPGFGAPPVSQPFGAPPAFGNSPSTPFASTTSTTTTSNPFAAQSQQQINNPFGVVQTTMSSAGSFGQSNFGSITTASIIDAATYTIEGQLTDDEKTSYLADQFVLGKIPIQPPTIELR